jgi:hypothetical protein
MVDERGRHPEKNLLQWGFRRTSRTIRADTAEVIRMVSSSRDYGAAARWLTLARPFPPFGNAFRHSRAELRHAITQGKGDAMNIATWHADWACGLPLIVVNVVIHVLGLGTINEQIVERVRNRVNHLHLTVLLVVITALAALLVTVLHGIEGAVWVLAYVGLGALPDFRTAMLYSLGAITSYGHAAIFLKPNWQMMGALEALNGMILFGLTTAFLFGLIRTVWPLGSTSHGGRD